MLNILKYLGLFTVLHLFEHICNLLKISHIYIAAVISPKPKPKFLHILVYKTFLREIMIKISLRAENF